MNTAKCLYSSDGLGAFVLGALATVIVCIVGIVILEVRRETA